MKKPFRINHPLVACHLTVLRDRTTNSMEFRQAVHRITTFLAFAATEDIQTYDALIETPLQETTGKRMRDRVGIVPILRAGIAMVDPLLNVIPTAEVWHLGLYRDENTAQPIRYYNKLPATDPVDLAIILDPMLATGGSACEACRALLHWGVKRIKMLSIISAPEGIDRLSKTYPDIDIYTCAIDCGLNESKFIVPGLGDAGDRIFNTTGH